MWTEEAQPHQSRVQQKRQKKQRLHGVSPRAEKQGVHHGVSIVKLPIVKLSIAKMLFAELLFAKQGFAKRAIAQ